MSFRGYDASDVGWGILSIAGTAVLCAFAIAIIVITVAGTIKLVQSMFTQEEPETIITEEIE